MQESMLAVIDYLLEAGKDAGAEGTEAHNGLQDLREGLINRTPYEDLSVGAQASLEAIIMMAMMN